MSFISDDSLDQNDPNKKKEAGNQGDGAALAGESGVLGASGAGGQAASGSNTAKSNTSGQFVNLQSYLDANKDQAADMANKITGSLSDKVSGAKSALDSATQEFNSKLDAGSVRPNEELYNETKSNAVGVANDPNKFNEFEKSLHANFSGPNYLEDTSGYNTAADAYSKANSEIDRSKSEAGRFGLLKDQYNRPDYSQGQQSLDQLLYQTAPNMRENFQKLQDQWGGLANALDQSKASSRAAAQKAAADTLAAKQSAERVLYGDQASNTPGLIDSSKKSLDDRVASGQAVRQSDFDKVSGQVKSNYMNKETLNRLGLEAGQNLWGLDLSNYLDPSAVGQLDRNMVATPEDAATFQALAKLSGQDALNQYITPAEALGSPVQFNSAKFQQDLDAQKRAYANALNNTYVRGTNGTQSVQWWLDTLKNAGSGYYTAPQAQAAINQANAIRARYGLGPITGNVYRDPRDNPGVFSLLPGLNYGVDPGVINAAARDPNFAQSGVDAPAPSSGTVSPVRDPGRTKPVFKNVLGLVNGR